MSHLSALTGMLLVAVFLGGVLGVGLAYAAWRRRDTRAAKPFALYSLAYSAWMFTAGFLWLSPGQLLPLIFDLLTEVVGTVTLLAWVFFVVSYTEQRDRFTGWRLWFIGGFTAATLLRVAAIAVLWFTGTQPPVIDYQGLTVVATRTGIEPWPYGLVLLTVGLAILFWTFYILWRYSRSELSGQQQQARLTLYAGMSPTVVYTGYALADVSFHQYLDPTPLFFIIAVVGTWSALFVYDFLDIEPVVANTLFETMSDPVLILDEDNAVLNANESATSLGFSADETVSDPLVAAIAGTETELSLETVDGDERVFDLSVSAITGGERRLVVLRDVTLRTERKRELQRQNERLDQFASVVSHDLRNPLNVAKGNLELIEETGELDRTDSVRRGLDRINTIIDDLLTMAKAGKAIDSPESVEVAAVAREAWHHVPTDETTLDIRTTMTVEADRTRLQELFENLFRNAMEHNETPLTITVKPITSQNLSAGFAVTDNGGGIPPADRTKVFEHGHTTSPDGTGLGLSIVQDIASAHDWDLDVTESETGGARFEITGCTESSTVETPDKPTTA